MPPRKSDTTKVAAGEDAAPPTKEAKDKKEDGVNIEVRSASENLRYVHN